MVYNFNAKIAAGSELRKQNDTLPIGYRAWWKTHPGEGLWYVRRMMLMI